MSGGPASRFIRTSWWLSSPELHVAAPRRSRGGLAVALAASGARQAWALGGLPGDAARARGDVGAAQQGRRRRCAGHRAHQVAMLLPAAACADAPAQPEAQVL